KTGGLGNDISDLPAVGCAPQWMSEKAVSIGQYFVSSGVYVVFGPGFPTTGSKVVTDYCFKEMENLYGGMWDMAETSNDFANKMIDKINQRRQGLGLDKKKERVLFDMAMRRELEATPLLDVGCHGPGG
ncbi:MAG: carbon monoxide dehydrogenase, partial [Deltaproteobacteria bacterium]|nr:carbon monoxide dehydrogenase [Deltaproteobacteria bacterium]